MIISLHLRKAHYLAGMMMKNITDFLLCPICRSDLASDNMHLVCKNNHNFIIKNGIWFLDSQGVVPSKTNSVWDKTYDQANISYFQDKLGYYRDKTDDVVFNEYYTFIDLLKKNVDGNKIGNYLDIGCGTGSYSLALNFAFDVDATVLVDKSLSALLIAKNLFKHFDIDCILIYTDAQNLPFKNKMFDLSITSGLFEHFDKAGQEQLVSEQCRVSKLISCHVPMDCMPYWIYRKIVELRNRGWPLGYEKPMKRSECIRLFRKNGFREVDYSVHNLFSSLLFSKKEYSVFKHIYNKYIADLFFAYEFVQVYSQID